jgi:hypothetical protein
MWVVYNAEHVYVRVLYREQGVYTSVNFQKKKKFGQTTWEREAGRHLEGDQRPNLTQNTQKTQKETENQIKPRSPTKTLERLPSGVANSATGKIPLYWV